MSQYYDLGDETLWNPSNGASRLFLHQVAAFEAELGLPSGIGPMEMDESQVDPAALGVFANALLDRYQQSLHAVVRALTEGFLLTVLALAERAGVGIRWEPSAPAPGAGLRDVQVPVGASAPDGVAELRRKVRELSRFMAR